MKKIQVRCETPGTDQEVWMDFLEIDGKKYRLVDESECDPDDCKVCKSWKPEKLENSDFSKAKAYPADYLDIIIEKQREIIDHLNNK